MCQSVSPRVFEKDFTFDAQAAGFTFDDFIDFTDFTDFLQILHLTRGLHCRVFGHDCSVKAP